MRCLWRAARLCPSNAGAVLPLAGLILHYALLRDGTELFRGTALSFSDTKAIQPFQEYSYQLKACTVAGCAASSQV